MLSRAIEIEISPLGNVCVRTETSSDPEFRLRATPHRADPDSRAWLRKRRKPMTHRQRRRLLRRRHRAEARPRETEPRAAYPSQQTQIPRAREGAYWGCAGAQGVSGSIGTRR